MCGRFFDVSSFVCVDIVTCTGEDVFCVNKGRTL